MLTELERRVKECSENFKELKNIKYQTEVTEMKKIIIELKNTLKGFNNGLSDTEESISDLEDRGNHLVRTAKRKKY